MGEWYRKEKKKIFKKAEKRHVDQVINHLISQRHRERENSNSKSLFHKDRSLGSVKNLSSRERTTTTKNAFTNNDQSNNYKAN